MGAHLARMQLIEFLRAFVARFPATGLAGPLVRQRSSFVGGVKHLPVRLDA